MHDSRLWSVGILIIAGIHASAAEPKSEFSPEQLAFFQDKVEPILKANCLPCHGRDPKKLKGDLNLAQRAPALKGGESGPSVVPGKAADSLLIQAVNHSKEGYAMPPGGKLKPAEIAVLTKWVNDGLAYPPDRIGKVAVEERGKKTVTPEQKAYWAYQPVKKPEVPAITDMDLAGWARTPIDHFVVAKLQAKGLKPNPPADKATLIRRAYYDLLGLPPQPEEVDAFVKDTEPDAWGKLVGRLLQSPHYGEKWGRYWLDIVRYAETNGYERDGAKPYAWRYRDYVIRSFNSDKPYTRFIREQLAGDEMPRSDSGEEIIATGYYRLGVWDDEPSDPKQALFDGYDDYVSITGQAFLGMTLNCARCHDHKGDPILQEDYYKLLAFFRDIRHYNNDRNARTSPTLTDVTPASQRKAYEEELAERMNKIEKITREITALEDAVIKTLSAADQRASEGPERPMVIKKVVPLFDAKTRTEYSRLKREVDQLKRLPIPAQVLALSVNNCDPNPPQVFVNIRGNPHADGAPVSPGFPEVLGLPDPMIPAAKPGARSSGRRSVLAEWIASESNPLTARVMMNRVWQNHFGRGLVPTANDFGKLGEGVTHPELLDYLAAEFMGGGDRAWTLKRMHKLIMNSAVYMQSSQAQPEGLKRDPANTWLWRFAMRRLNAEEIRDSLLMVSGLLNLEQFGESVYPKIPHEVLAGQSVPGSGWHYKTARPTDGNRRSIYVHVKRSLQVPILLNHDQADPDNSCPVRYTTTVPTQALGMLNSEFTNDVAAALAARLKKEAGDDPARQVTLGIRLTTGRTPGAKEVERDVKFIQELQTKHKLSTEKALAQYALLLVNTNEFVYVD